MIAFAERDLQRSERSRARARRRGPVPGGADLASPDINAGQGSRVLLLVPIGVALYYTNSRGGMLGLGLCWCRTDIGASDELRVAVGATALLGLVILFGPSRMANLDASESSAQDRVQSWAEGLQMLRAHPLFGVGFGRYTEFNELVAHNSFVHTLGELGLFGAFFFVGMGYWFFYSTRAPDRRPPRLGRGLVAERRRPRGMRDVPVASIQHAALRLAGAERRLPPTDGGRRGAVVRTAGRTPGEDRSNYRRRRAVRVHGRASVWRVERLRGQHVMASDRLRVALIGCGQIADAHLQELRRIPAASVVAVCDLHIDLARQAATRFGVPLAFDDVSRMLGEARPDVVHITTPPHSHRALAIQCLAARAHVYVEKPFTVDERRPRRSSRRPTRAACACASATISCSTPRGRNACGVWQRARQEPSSMSRPFKGTTSPDRSAACCRPNRHIGFTGCLAACFKT